jgi:putative ABC transport system ATP-binding protein
MTRNCALKTTLRLRSTQRELTWREYNHRMTAFLRFHDLSKSYYEGDVRRVVLQNAHAEYQPGEITAILGKSGSGKSTLLNLISGIDAPDSGQIWVDGQDLTGLSERDRTLFRRARIGFIFQFFNLIPTLTVGENVSLPLELNRISRQQTHKKARDMLEAVGLLDRWKTFPEKLSGGEQQRVALARALVHDPLLILADEPTGNLDEETGTDVMSLLTRLAREQNRTLLLVTHSLEAASPADRVLRLSHGQLVSER